MRRIAGIAGALLISLVILAPVALAAEPPAPDRVLVSVNGDVGLPAGEQAAVVVVIRGDATVAGQVKTLVIVDGSAQLTGAQAGNIVAVRSDVTLGVGTVVTGDIRTLDATVEQIGDAEVMGQVRDISVDLVAIGAVLAPALILFAIGFGLMAIAAGLTLAALAARQVRAAETLISRQPFLTLGVGLLAMVVLPIVSVVAMITVIGAPMGLAILFGVWPLTAFIGYLVAAIWIGESILGRLSPTVTRERPYLAAVLGIVVLWVLSIVPLATAIASLFGFGAVILLAWRTFRGDGLPAQTVTRQAPAPIGA